MVITDSGNISFVKMSGAGNDFIIIDTRKNNYQLSSAEIAKLSDRKNIGCDQFIILKHSQEASIFMDIYNADGSSSPACGNATRCVAYLMMQEFNIDEVKIQTQSQIIPCKREKDAILVNMGKPKFSPKDIPLAKNLNSNIINIDNFEFYGVNMGNPHIVTFLDQNLSDEDFFKFGPKLENHSYFPLKTNIEFVNKAADNHFKVRVWERGVGETLSCGSGACAVGAAAFQKNLANGEVKISFKGGDIFISLNKNGEIIMKGGVTTIFYGMIPGL